MPTTSATSLPDATKLAVDRTRLAHDRTLMAWVRTATSLISFGFSLYKFFEDLRERPQFAGDGGVIGPRGFALVMILDWTHGARSRHRRTSTKHAGTQGRVRPRRSVFARDGDGRLDAVLGILGRWPWRFTSNEPSRNSAIAPPMQAIAITTRPGT